MKSIAIMTLTTVMLRMEKTKSLLAQSRSSDVLLPDQATYSQDRPVAVVQSIEPLRIDTVYVAPAAGQIGSRSLIQQLVVVRHEAIGGNLQVPKVP